MFLDWLSFILLFILLDSFPTVVFPLTMTLHPSNDPSFIRPTDRSSALNAFTFVAYCVEFFDMYCKNVSKYIQVICNYTERNINMCVFAVYV